MSLHFPPSEKKGPHITVRFPLSTHTIITGLANEHHTTVTEVVRALVRAGLEQATTPPALPAAPEVASSKEE
jgi:hypothetical protein